MESVIGKRQASGETLTGQTGVSGIEHHVKWKGWAQPTWEPCEGLETSAAKHEIEVWESGQEKMLQSSGSQSSKKRKRGASCTPQKLVGSCHLPPALLCKMKFASWFLGRLAGSSTKCRGAQCEGPGKLLRCKADTRHPSGSLMLFTVGRAKHYEKAGFSLTKEKIYFCLNSHCHTAHRHKMVRDKNNSGGKIATWCQSLPERGSGGPAYQPPTKVTLDPTTELTNQEIALVASLGLQVEPLPMAWKQEFVALGEWNAAS